MSTLWDTPERRRRLLCELVGWDSVTGTAGEAAFAGRLADAIRQVPHFAERPERVHVETIDHGRAFVAARYVQDAVRDTIVLISHFDTVDTQDYGVLEPLAFDPERLTAAYAADPATLDPDAAADAASGEWLFGRGTMDMKAGLALHLATLERATHDGWPVNLVLLAVPDEEVNSAGMRAAATWLRELAEREDLRYVLFLNGEPTFPAHPGDTARYAYSGSIGKLLPSVLCYGRETHAGTPLKGLTSTFLASRITQAVELSDAFRETVHGETTPLPVTLDQHDRRDGYSTQTPFRTSALYNVFVMERSADTVLDTFERGVRGAVGDAERDYRAVCEREGVAPIGDVRVLRFEELELHAREQLGDERVEQLVTSALEEGDGDLREQSLRVVESLLAACRELTPAVVCLYAPPFYPAVNSTDDDLVRACIERVQAVSRERFGHDVTWSHFFNGISDLSYVAFRGGDGASQVYAANTPGFGRAYDVPFADMAALDAPVLNVGPYGKDPHQRSERVHVVSAFEQLPELVADLVQVVAERTR